MKKRNIIIAAMLALSLTALSGCGTDQNAETSASGTVPADTTASVSEKTQNVTEKTETSVFYEAGEEEDTTSEAIEFISRTSPLLANYFTIHTQFPLSMVYTTEKDDGIYETGLIIKDEQNMAQYVTDPSGSTTRIIYTGDMAYQINESEKVVYGSQIGEFFVKSGVNQNIMTLSARDTASMKFVEDTAEFDGAEYKHASLGDGSTVYSDYYFDKDTDELKAVVNSSGEVTRFSVYSNTVYDETLFDIPTDYKSLSGDELLDKEEEAQETTQSAQ